MGFAHEELIMRFCFYEQNDLDIIKFSDLLEGLFFCIGHELTGILEDKLLKTQWHIVNGKIIFSARIEDIL